MNRERTIHAVLKARRKFFCSESKGSLTKLPLQVKFETKARILAMRPQVCWRPHYRRNRDFILFIIVLFFSIPVASKENDRESDRPYSSVITPSTAQSDQSDIVTYCDE